MESRHTTAGRLRSSFYDMHLRVPFLEGRVLGLDAVSVGYGPLVYPGRQRPLPLRLEHAPLRRGPLRPREGPRDLPPLRRRVHRRRHQPGRGAGGRPRLRQAFGDDLWDDWRRSASHRYALQKEEAERRGLTRRARLTYDAPAPRGDAAAAASSSATARWSTSARTTTRSRPTCASTSPPARDASLAGVRRRAGVAHARRPRAGVPAAELHPARAGASRAAPTPAGTTSTTSTSASGDGPAAHARLPRARARRLARRHAGRLRAVGGSGARQLALVPIDGGAPARAGARRARARLHARPSRPTGG